MKKYLSAFLAGLILVATPPSNAAFRASPVRVYLGPELRSELITLSNQGDRAVRLQVVAQAWSESSHGEQILAPTDDLVIFPSLVTLGPGESRQIRVGIVEVANTREATYRIIVTELPEQDLPGAPHGVVIRTRLSLPVFATPATATAIPDIAGLALGPEGLDFALVNDGMRHARTGAIEVTFEGPKGTTAVTTIDGWYLLSGGRRDYHLDLPKLPCVARAGSWSRSRSGSTRAPVSIVRSRPPRDARADPHRLVPPRWLRDDPSRPRVSSASDARPGCTWARRVVARPSRGERCLTPVHLVPRERRHPWARRRPRGFPGAAGPSFPECRHQRQLGG